MAIAQIPERNKRPISLAQRLPRSSVLADQADMVSVILARARRMGVTVTKLCQTSGISRSTLWRFLRATDRGEPYSIGGEQLFRLARAVGANVTLVVSETEDDG